MPFILLTLELNRNFTPFPSVLTLTPKTFAPAAAAQQTFSAKFEEAAEEKTRAFIQQQKQQQHKKETDAWQDD